MAELNGAKGANVLALNAGSSTLKYRLIRMPAAPSRSDTGGAVLAKGSFDHVGDAGIVRAAEGVVAETRHLGVDAVGHRIVHGGHLFSEPVLIDAGVLRGLRSLEPLDPLHNPAQVHVVEAAVKLLPGVPNVAVFDTAFHATIPDVAALYALPLDLSRRLHVRRYGFHGLSHKYVSEELARLLHTPSRASPPWEAPASHPSPPGDGPTIPPSPPGEGPGVRARLITCHLGNGASICAIRDGRSVDTSMGLTPLEGLVMGTRAGDLDPGLVLYLQRAERLAADDLDRLLNTQSGLLGLSGKSGDVRDLEEAAASGDDRAGLALAIFAYRARKYIGAYAAALGGVDAVAFAGGIGEHSPAMRARICDGLAFLGITLDPEANEAARGAEPVRIDARSAAVQVWVVPTDEEAEIAREAAAVVSGK